MQKSEIALLQEMRNALARAVDGATFAQVAIDYDHHKIHEGDTFTAHYENSTAGIGEEIAIGFLTPAAASGRVHMVIDIRGTVEAIWELREDPTIVLAQGTAYTPLNRFRDSANTSAMFDNSAGAGTVNRVTTYNVAQAAAGNLAASGAVLHSETIAIGGAAPFASIVNAQSRGQREWILAAATEYVVIVESSAAGDYEISLNWYEAIHKNE